MTEREKLAEIFNCNCEHCYGRQNKIAEYIIEDRKRIVAPLIKLGQIKKQPLPTYETLCQGIEETLWLVGVE